MNYAVKLKEIEKLPFIFSVSVEIAFTHPLNSVRSNRMDLVQRKCVRYSCETRLDYVIAADSFVSELCSVHSLIRDFIVLFSPRFAVHSVVLCVSLLICVCPNPYVRCMCLSLRLTNVLRLMRLKTFVFSLPKVCSFRIRSGLE